MGSSLSQLVLDQFSVIVGFCWLSFYSICPYVRKNGRPQNMLNNFLSHSRCICILLLYLYTALLVRIPSTMRDPLWKHNTVCLSFLVNVEILYYLKNTLTESDLSVNNVTEKIDTYFRCHI